MIKYRVHEVAKDLGIASKEVISLLKEHLGEEKKHMTALYISLFSPLILFCINYSTNYLLLQITYAIKIILNIYKF